MKKFKNIHLILRIAQMSSVLFISTFMKDMKPLCEASDLQLILILTMKTLSWEHNAMWGQDHLLNDCATSLQICDQRQEGDLYHMEITSSCQRSLITTISLKCNIGAGQAPWYYWQASWGHVRSNAALIEFVVFWTGRLSRHNTIISDGKRHCRTLWSNISKAGKPANP